jgi:hypothetical protein
VRRRVASLQRLQHGATFEAMSEIHERQAGRRRGTPGRVRFGAVVAALALFAACSSDDAVESIVETSVSSTTVLAGAAGSATPPTTEPELDESAPEPTAAPDDSTDAGADAATDCLVGEWVLDGPQFVANAAAWNGEPVQHESGTYVYTFSDDGSFSVDVALDIIIQGDEGAVRVESRGTEEGTWTVATPDDIAAADGIEPVDLPHVVVETTSVAVSETGFFNGTPVPLGEVDQDQGLDGVGPVDCAAGTMVIRGTVPFPIEYPFIRQ